MTKKKAAVKKVIDQFFHALDKQDMETMSLITAHDAEMVHIGTDTEEYWVGWEHLKKDTIRMFDGLEAYKVDIQDLRISLSQSGDVAWFSFVLDSQVVANKQTVKTENGRFSGVMEKRGDQWKMVQTHLSLPQSEQVVTY